VLADVGETWRPRGATAIVMDPRSGALLALANWPRVDANNPATRPTTRARTARSPPPTSPARRSRRSPSPGALEEHEVTPGTKFGCRRRSASTTA
jgi:cell division protein FtsI (penicillin-binding protein 3)/stage V sporulation protein D (sporulation-specific penicillin-binding protein)